MNRAEIKCCYVTLTQIDTPECSDPATLRVLGPPLPVTNLKAMPNSTSFTLTWDPTVQEHSSVDPPDGFSLEHFPSIETTPVADIHYVVTVDGVDTVVYNPVYTFSPVNPNPSQLFEFSVTAVNVVGNGTPSAPVTAKLNAVPGKNATGDGKIYIPGVIASCTGGGIFLTFCCVVLIVFIVKHYTNLKVTVKLETTEESDPEQGVADDKPKNREYYKTDSESGEPGKENNCSYPYGITGEDKETRQEMDVFRVSTEPDHVVGLRNLAHASLGPHVKCHHSVETFHTFMEHPCDGGVEMKPQSLIQPEVDGNVLSPLPLDGAVRTDQRQIQIVGDDEEDYRFQMLKTLNLHCYRYYSKLSEDEERVIFPRAA